jgi:hypothetical protein
LFTPLFESGSARVEKKIKIFQTRPDIFQSGFLRTGLHPGDTGWQMIAHVFRAVVMKIAMGRQKPV